MRRFLSLFTMLMLCGIVAFAQSRVVSGKVTDSDGKGVPFATVKIRGSQTGLSADANGTYSIKVKEGDVLEFSSAGFESQRVTVRNSNVIDVQMKATQSMEGVVVTALGIRRQAKELGYSTTKINTEELNQGKVTNVATGLAAKVSGLQVNLTNNSVKGDVRITLRGNRSILGNNQALLVVDDVILPIGFIGTINPNDIDNVNILKGSSAAALYGSEASNGVIIITTKKGVKGKAVIKMSSTASFETISYMPEFQNEFGPWGGEPASFPGMITFPNQPGFIYAPYENQNYGPRFNGQKVPIGAPIRIFRNDGSYFIAQDSTLYSPKANAKKNFFDQGLTFTNDVSYSAGDDKSKFFFSFQDVNIKGVLPGDVNRRDAIRANGSRETGIFKVDYNVGYTLGHANTTPGTTVPFTSTTGQGGNYGATAGGSYFQNRPVYWTIINQPAMADLRDYRNWQQNPFANPNGYFNAYYGNPWWAIDQTRLDERNSDLIANFSITVKPFEWMDLMYRAGIARNDYTNKYTQAGFTFADWAIADTLGSGNIPSGVKKLSPSEGDFMSYQRRLTSDVLATIHRTIKKNFDLKLTLGTSLLDIKSRNLSVSAASLIIPDFYNINNRVGEAAVTEAISEQRRVGAFADLTLGYKNWIFLHGSARNDWTSLLPDGNRSFLYPGGDLAFIFTDAIPGLKNNKILSYGKLRAALAKTGQVNVGPYSNTNTFNAGGGFPFGGVGGFSLSATLNNPNLKPEISIDKEIGLELGFLKNRIMLSGAYYITNTTNQTLPVSIASSTGFTAAVINSGEMQNKGYEVDLKVSPVVKTRSGFRWDVGANYSHNDNTVLSLYPGLPQVNIGASAWAVVGQPYGQLRVSDWSRDPNGNIIVDRFTGYPTAAANQPYFGTTNPPDKVGLNTSISFKGFTLSAVADGRFGAVIDNGIGNNLDFTGVSAYSAQSGRQPFVIPNSVYWDGAKYVPNTNINTQDGNLAFWASTWNAVESNYVNSADFWKLREVSLGYTVPKKLLTSYIKGVSFQVTGRNLFTKKSKDNVWSDPEFANNTGNGTGRTDINQLPATKFIAVSLNVTF